MVAQGVGWASRYDPPDDGLGKLVATVAAQVPRCSAVNAGGPDDRARLLAAGATVTEFSDGPSAAAAGVRYFVLTGATATGGPLTPSLAAWVREHGDRLAAHPSRSLSGIELWRVDPAPLDPVADSLPVPGGMFSNVTGSACGGYRVADSQLGAFYTAYRAVGGKAVLGRPLGSVWTSDGPARPAALGRLAVRLGLVPKQALRLEPVPGLPARPAEIRLDTGPLLRPLGLVLGLLALAAAAGTVHARRSRSKRPDEAVADS